MEASVAVEQDQEYMSPFAQKQYVDKYAWKDEDGEPMETWPDTAYRVTRNVLGALGYTDHDIEFQKILSLITERKFLPGGRYLANSGRQLHQTQNCALYRADDSREGWMELVRKCGMSLMLGAGVGVVYSDIRGEGASIRLTGGTASGPISLMQMVNEVARHVISGGNRRSAIWAGLHWNHPDCEQFIKIKDWSDEIKAAKVKDFNNPAPLDMTNISVILDNEFFFAYENEAHPKYELAHHIYDLATKRMLESAEPGFSVDIGDNEGENLRNACTEITSHDDSDICNLGSLNMARIESLEEFKDATKLATLFLLAGTVYSTVPHEEIKATREKNRRLGLGLMGIHEWLLVRGHHYEVNDDLRDWLSAYRDVSDFWAAEYAAKHNISEPVKKRAIAPNGTIGIVAETTTGVEPIFCVAQKRRFRDTDGQWRYQYVINPTAERLIKYHDVEPDDIEDAYRLSYDLERRIKFQADIQEYVDHGISSTINLPYPIVEENERKDTADLLYKYLPKLRGITCYPDGARAGQPLTAVLYEIAHDKVGVTFEEDEETCVGGVCGL